MYGGGRVRVQWRRGAGVSHVGGHQVADKGEGKGGGPQRGGSPAGFPKGFPGVFPLLGVCCSIIDVDCSPLDGLRGVYSFHI